MHTFLAQAVKTRAARSAKALAVEESEFAEPTVVPEAIPVAIPTTAGS